MKISKKKTIIISILLLKIILHTLWEYNYTYDHNRNLMVTHELRNYGTLTYFGRAYIINPPLYYTINSLIGSTHQVLQYSELMIYFLASITVYLITKRILNEKAGLTAYTLMMLNPIALYIEEIDFFAINLLMTGILIITYQNFLNEPKRKNTAILGITLGLCMLTKDSFAIAIATIVTHYLIFERKHLSKAITATLIGILVYSPWLIYLYINQLKLPWQSHIGDITGNLEWGETTIMPIYRGYQLLIENWPIMTIIGIITLFSIKNNKSLLKLMYTITIIGPLIARIILNYFVIDVVIFIGIGLPAITAVVIHVIKNKKTKYAIITLLIIEFTIGNINLIINKGSFNTYECELFDYIKTLNENETVMVYTGTYALFNTLSKAKFDYAGNQEMLYFYTIFQNAKKIMTTTDEINLTAQFKTTCNILGQGEKEFKIYNILSLETKIMKTVKIMDNNGKPLSNAVAILRLNNQEVVYYSNNAGELVIRTQLEPEIIKITRNGYELKIFNNINEIPERINLAYTPFTINFKSTRY